MTRDIAWFYQVRMRLRTLPDWVLDLTTVRTRSGRLYASNDAVTIEHRDLEVVEPQDALLFAARHAAGFGYNLLLDIDINDARLVRSSGGKGWHLYVPAHMTREQHDRVLDALADAGIVQDGFRRSAKATPYGATLRLPWVRKGKDSTLREQLDPPLPF